MFKYIHFLLLHNKHGTLKTIYYFTVVKVRILTSGYERPKSKCQLARSYLETLGKNPLPGSFRLSAECCYTWLQDWSTCFLGGCQLGVALSFQRVHFPFAIQDGNIIMKVTPKGESHGSQFKILMTTNIIKILVVKEQVI